MGANDDMSRSTTRLAGPDRTNAVHVTTPQNATITSQTAATVPSNRARTRLGVGESVDVTFSGGSATWSISPANTGSLSATSGPTVTYTAPDRANTVTITATAGASATITFTIVEPSDVRMSQRSGTVGHHTINTASAGVIADIFILPADVSFENISYLESDVNAVGTGCFQQYYQDNPTGHNPNTSPLPIGPPVSDTSGSKAPGYDQIDCSASKCAGGWTWSIPWSFQVGSGSPKQFKVVDQVTTITATGTATVNKVGATNTAAFGSPTVKDPLFI
jgi:hypothetical protein